MSHIEMLERRGYRLLNILGSGSHAKVDEVVKVYMAEFTADNLCQRPVACKLVDMEKVPRNYVVKFLPNELEILRRIKHPHIIETYSIIQWNKRYVCTFMQLAEKGDLLDFILENGAVGENQMRVWFRQITLAVQYMHTLEIVHRDLKCENILITAKCNVKVSDFGFARSILDDHGSAILSETFCGSLCYIAPEVLKGLPYNPKISDMWGLGVILFVALNCAMPFKKFSQIMKMYEAQMSYDWAFRKKISDELSSQVKSLVKKLLEPDVTKRLAVQQILNSEWMAMNPKCLILSKREKSALEKAEEEITKIKKKSSNSYRLPKDSTKPLKKETQVNEEKQKHLERTENTENNNLKKSTYIKEGNENGESKNEEGTEPTLPKDVRSIEFLNRYPSRLEESEIISPEINTKDLCRTCSDNLKINICDASSSNMLGN
ncbi:unnamed protein product [Timema podura]|uniref:Protein kinase domain-containing protein n=1 Tax=Timema podura TaxID=61482 RepID=A0ABN7P7S7_TIMPD|nr:unnamed protein product [Timema podura]